MINIESSFLFRVERLALPNSVCNCGQYRIEYSDLLFTNTQLRARGGGMARGPSVPPSYSFENYKEILRVPPPPPHFQSSPAVPDTSTSVLFRAKMKVEPSQTVQCEHLGQD